MVGLRSIINSFRNDGVNLRMYGVRIPAMDLSDLDPPYISAKSPRCWPL